MPSDKTRALRERDLELKLKLLPRPITTGGGYMSELKDGGIISASRRNRLKAERIGLTRAQRIEIRDLRRQRKTLGYDPPQPAWTKAKKNVDVAELAQMIAQADAEDEPALVESAQQEST